MGRSLRPNENKVYAINVTESEVVAREICGAGGGQFNTFCRADGADDRLVPTVQREQRDGDEV